MRERIKVELSEQFKSEVLLPWIIEEFKTGLHEMILLNKAYAIMLGKTGIVDKDSIRQILAGLGYVEQNMTTDDLDGKYEDFYFNVEMRLREKIGPVAGRLHAGRSRNDISSTLMRMEIRKSIWPVIERLLDLLDLLLTKADAGKTKVMTGYTHQQPGQPITLGYYYTAIAGALRRDLKRLQAAYDSANICPYGGAAFAGSSFPVDRQLLADLLGFDAVLENCMDGIASRDYVLQAEMAYTLMMINVSRAAEDMYFWVTDEFHSLEIGGEIAMCSSIMPQKKNPVSLEFAKAKCAHAIGAMMSTATALKNVPFSNNLDIAESPTMYYIGQKQTLQGMGMLMEAIRHSELNEEHCRKQAAKNLSTVTGLADYLVKTYGMSFTDAHHIVGTMVATILESGEGIEGMTGAMLAKVSGETVDKPIQMTDQEIAAVLDPFNNVESKRGVGGPSVESVADMIRNGREAVGAGREWLERSRNRVAQAYLAIENTEKAL